jgi:hypothetical protein
LQAGKPDVSLAADQFTICDNRPWLYFAAIMGMGVALNELALPSQPNWM